MKNLHAWFPPYYIHSCQYIRYAEAPKMQFIIRRTWVAQVFIWLVQVTPQWLNWSSQVPLSEPMQPSAHWITDGANCSPCAAVIGQNALMWWCGLRTRMNTQHPPDAHRHRSDTHIFLARHFPSCHVASKTEWLITGTMNGKWSPLFFINEC